jgi:Porin PorA
MLRRVISLAFIGAGVFALVLAYLLPNVIYPRITQMMVAPELDLSIRAEGATVLVTRGPEDGGIRVLTDTGVSGRLSMRPDPRANTSPNAPNAFWRVTTQTFIDGVGLGTASVEGISYDRKTFRTNNCCGDYLITQANDTTGEALQHEGYAFVFPPNTQRTEYPLWDLDNRRTFPARFVGTEKRNGIDTYRFSQEVPESIVTTVDLPAELFTERGATATSPFVKAKMNYSATNTYWVEPGTGALADLEMDVKRDFIYNGTAVPVLHATLKSVPDPKLTEGLAKVAPLIPYIRGGATSILVPFGVIHLLLGLWLQRPRRVREELPVQRELVGVG